MTAPLTLVSHALCPYVQRAAIVLAEKGVPFERRWVDHHTRPGKRPGGGSIEKIKQRIREIIQFPKIRTPRRRKSIR